MHPWLLAVLTVLTARLVVATLADWLNLRHAADALPDAARGLYDAPTYARSQRYLRVTTRFAMLHDLLATASLAAFLALGGCGALDRWVRACDWPPIPTGLVFAGALALAARLLSLPFDLYDTFVIEQRFGFNRTTPRTFVLDTLKSLLLLALLGGPLLAAVLALFAAAGAAAWLWTWAVLTLFQILLIFVAPVLIMPLFNTYTPLPDGELRAAIEAYARDQRFAMRGIFTMDGSRRSSKTNAFFTGFGRSRRIVLFDTLVARHTVPELLAVIAHEMGHYKLRHIPLAILRSVLLTGLTLWLLSRFIGHPGLSGALGFDAPTLYGGLVAFGFLYTPIGLLVAVAENAISRRHEFAADAFAARTTGSPAPLADALRKLSVDNLSNLTPHPLKVCLSYSHPPLLARLAALAPRQPAADLKIR